MIIFSRYLLIFNFTGAAGNNIQMNPMSKVGQPIVQPSSISTVEPPGSAAIATGQKYATNFPIVITSSISTAMSSNTDTVLSTASVVKPVPTVDHAGEEDGEFILI